jgi:PAS domain S-box-containing protein
MGRQFVYSSILGVLVLFGLFLAQEYSFLLFHSLAEGFSIVIACGIFMMAWNTRRFMISNYLLFAGIAYLFIGGLDLMHTLIYKGMGVFHGYNANAATQLWIAARYTESVSLLLAPIWIGRKLIAGLVFWVYAALFTMLLAAILSGRLFPDCFIEGTGLTSFKIVSEYIICVVLMASLALLYLKRQHFDPGVLRLLFLSIILTMASEIAFTFYVSVYGLSNQIGHYLKIVSFFLIYKAIIQTGLLRPYDLLFRDLNQSRERVQAARDQLEQRVQERTADLLAVTTKLQAEIAERKEAQKALLELNRMLKTLSECNQSLVRATDEKTFLSTMCRNIVMHGGYGITWVVLAGQNQNKDLSVEALTGEDADFLAEINMTRIASTDPDDPISTVLRTGRAEILKDIRSGTGSIAWLAAAAKRGYAAVLILPLKNNGDTLGALTICSDQPDAFESPQLQLLTELANDASFGIATLRLHRQRKVVEMERQLLVTAIDQASECIAIADSDASIEYINQAVERITGFEPSTCVGRPLTALLIPNQAVPARAILRNLKAGKTWSGRIKSKNIIGAVLDLSVAISPVRGPSQRIEHFVAIIRDISRECQMEYQLIQSQKMEAIGTLAGGIAHDFNNILSAIIGYTELTAGVVGKNTMAYENLGEVLKAGRRAKDLVHQILAFSRQTIPECKPVSLKHIIEEAAKLLRSSLPATIEIRQRLDSDGVVMADPTQMHQVVMNLCTNAAHAMQENGGLLELALQKEVIDDEMAACYPEIQPGPYQKLIVSDTGCGMSQDIKDHIFDPFFTTKANNEGTGMGLSVVHGIVRACGGMILVSSEPQKGSRFSVFIPTIAQVEESYEADEGPIPMGCKEHILFIDDEPTLVNMGRQVLESLGYQVTTRTDGTEALNLIKAQPDRFDLVFTDMTMPKITGDILAQQILAIRPELPVIVCSGFSYKMDECKAAAMGIRAYVRKPVLREQMARIIREVLENKTPDASSHKGKTVQTGLA